MSVTLTSRESIRRAGDGPGLPVVTQSFSAASELAAVRRRREKTAPPHPRPLRGSCPRYLRGTTQATTRHGTARHGSQQGTGATTATDSAISRRACGAGSSKARSTHLACATARTWYADVDILALAAHLSGGSDTGWLCVVAVDGIQKHIRTLAERAESTGEACCVNAVAKDHAAGGPGAGHHWTSMYVRTGAADEAEAGFGALPRRDPQRCGHIPLSERGEAPGNTGADVVLTWC